MAVLPYSRGGPRGPRGPPPRRGGPEGARALEVLEKAEKEGEVLLLSHEEAGALLKALYEGLLRSLEEED